MHPEGAGYHRAGPAVVTAFGVLIALLLTACGGGSDAATAVDDGPEVQVAVDLTGVQVEVHQAPG